MERKVLRWEAVEAIEGLPEVYGHTSVFLGDGLVVFGGSNAVGKFSSEGCVVWVDRGQVERLPAVEAGFAPRHFHAAFELHGRLHIQGGKCNGYLSDASMLKSSPFRWRDSPWKLKREHMARFGHTAVVCPDQSVLVFGGYDLLSTVRSDLVVLPPPHKRSASRPRALRGRNAPDRLGRFHHTAVYFDRCMYVWGGRDDRGPVGTTLLEYSLDSGQWAQLATEGLAPSPRYGHASALVGPLLYVHGGYDGSACYADLYVCNLRTRTWSHITLSACPSPRYFHTLTARFGTLYLYGGLDKMGTVYGSLHALTLSEASYAESWNRSVSRFSEQTGIAMAIHEPPPPVPLARSTSEVGAYPSMANAGLGGSGSSPDSGGVLTKVYSSAAGSDGTLRVKCVLRHEVRQFVVSCGTSLGSMRELIVREYQLRHFVLQYEDEEGDHVTIRSESNWRAAIQGYLALRMQAHFQSSGGSTSSSGSSRGPPTTPSFRLSILSNDPLYLADDAPHRASSSLVMHSDSELGRSMMPSSLPSDRMGSSPHSGHFSDGSGYRMESDTVLRNHANPAHHLSQQRIPTLLLEGEHGEECEDERERPSRWEGHLILPHTQPSNMGGADPSHAPPSRSDRVKRRSRKSTPPPSSRNSTSPPTPLSATQKGTTADGLHSNALSLVQPKMAPVKSPRNTSAVAIAQVQGEVEKQSAARSPVLGRIRWKKCETVLGTGAFGSVYEGMNLETGELMAVKEVRLDAASGGDGTAEDPIAALKREVATLQNLRHEHIVRYLGTAQDSRALYIFLELVPGGSLTSLLRKFHRLPEPVVQSFTRQILRGLEYLHAQRIVHRDIKGANILVDINGRVKLSDFGTARELVDAVSCRTVVGSPYWMAPEVILGHEYGFPADLWSVGSVVVEMLSGKPPHGSLPSMMAMWKVSQGDMQEALPQDISSDAADFLRECFRMEPVCRPSARALLAHHPFVAQPSLAQDCSLQTPGSLQFLRGDAPTDLRRAQLLGVEETASVSSVSDSEPAHFLSKWSARTDHFDSEQDLLTDDDALHLDLEELSLHGRPLHLSQSSDCSVDSGADPSLLNESQILQYLRSSLGNSSQSQIS